MSNRIKSILVVALSLLTFQGFSQSKVYQSSGLEFMLSFADVELANEKVDMVPRFTAFLNVQSLWNYDVSDHVGFFSGGAIRNVGIITEPNDSLKLKQRSYALGVPLGIKLGSLDKKFFVFAGGEAELMFHYKEKQFINGDKQRKSKEWFSDKVNLFNPSVFAGIQLPGGMNVKFKYYLNDFLNQAYTETVGGVKTKPYSGLKSQMMYVSVGFNLYKRKK